MKRVLLCIVGLCINIHVFGSDVEKKKVDQLNDKSKSFLFKQQDSVIYFASQAKELADKIGYRYGIAKSSLLKSRIYIQRGQFNTAHIYLLKSIKELLESDTVDLYNEHTIYRDLARTSIEYKQYDQAISYYNESLKSLNSYLDSYPDLAKKYNDHKLVDEIKFFRASAHRKKGDIKESQSSLEEIWTKADTEGNYDLVAKAMNELGLVLKDIKEFEMAKSHFYRIINYESLSDLNRALAMQNVGSILMLQEKHEDSEKMLLRSIELGKGLKERYVVFRSYLDLGELYFNLGHNVKAISIWEKAIEHYSDISYDPTLFKVYWFLQEAHRDNFEKYRFYSERYDILNQDFFENQNRIKEESQEFIFKLTHQLFIENFDRKIKQEGQFWANVFMGFGLVLFSIGVIILLFRLRKSSKEVRSYKWKIKELYKVFDSNRK